MGAPRANWEFGSIAGRSRPRRAVVGGEIMREMEAPRGSVQLPASRSAVRRHAHLHKCIQITASWQGTVAAACILGVAEEGRIWNME